MSEAVAQSYIKYRIKSGVYSTEIVSPSGDLVQYYTGSQQQVQKVYMDFKVIQPKLYLQSVSSRQTEGVVAFTEAVKVTVNGIQMSFDPDTKVNTTPFGGRSGQFKLIKANGSAASNGIQIIDNILQDSSFLPITITMVGKVVYGTQTDTLQASYTIPVMLYSGSGTIVTIKAGSNNNFTIPAKGETVILDACAYDFETGNELDTSNLKYVWQSAVPTDEGWETLSATTKTLTVTEKMVASYGDFRVIISDANSNQIGTDTRTVADATDPLIINTNPNPLDETIDEDTSGNGSVTYTPQVATRGGSVLSGYKFRFSVKDAAGMPLNKWQNGVDDELASEMATTPQEKYTVTRAQCQQGNGDLSITIFAVES